MIVLIVQQTSIDDETAYDCFVGKCYAFSYTLL